MDVEDKEEFIRVAEYLEYRYANLSNKKVAECSPKQLIQMINTIRRAIAIIEWEDEE